MTPKQLDFTELQSAVSNSEALRTNALQEVAVSAFYLVFGILSLSGLAVLAQVNKAPLLLAIIGTGVCFMVVIGYGLFWEFKKRGSAMVRMQRFALKNNLTYYNVGQPTAEETAGLIFSTGHSQSYRDLLIADTWRIGNYEYVTGYGRSSETHKHGVIVLKLARTLPHLVFDSKKNNFVVSNLPVIFDKHQALHLEGSFDKAFNTYAPANYAIDVLSYVTPEVMALLLDEFRNFDVEIVDNKIFLYRNTFFDEVSELQSLLKASTQLQKEFNENSAQYQDDRVPRTIDHEKLIAPAGQRLKMHQIRYVGVTFASAYFFMRIVGQHHSNDPFMPGVVITILTVSLIIYVVRRSFTT